MLINRHVHQPDAESPRKTHNCRFRHLVFWLRALLMSVSSPVPTLQWVPMKTRCLPRGLQSRPLAAALAPLAKTRVLHIADAPRAWGGWSDSSVGSYE